nr:ankyrin repeat domain containing protein [Mimivirus sp.]
MTSLVKYLYTDTKSFEYDPQIVKLLLEYGTNPNIYGKYHNLIASPLFVFCGGRLDDLEMIKLFLNKGADINSPGPNKSLLSRVINYYVQCYIDKWEKENAHRIIELLLERGADINIIDNDGSFPLLILIKKFHKFDFRDMIIKLIKYGADINLSNNNKETVLSYLIRKKRHIDLIEFLLKFKPNMNHQKYISGSYLMSAVETKNNDLIKLLIKYGANINFDNNYLPVLHKALSIESDNGPEIVDILLENGADPNYFCNGATVFINFFISTIILIKIIL